MEIIEGIEIIDFYISDEAIYVLERLTDLRNNHEYETLRNIIYNSKDIDEANERIKHEEDGRAFNKKIEIRVRTDENIRNILRFLGSAVGLVRIKDYDLILNMIFGEWVIEEEKKKFNINTEFNYTNYGEVTYPALNIRGDLWKRVKEIGNNRGLGKDEYLKLAVVRFLERRYELVREILM